MGWRQALEPYIGGKVRATLTKKARFENCIGTLVSADDDCITIDLRGQNGIQLCVVSTLCISDIDIRELPATGASVSASSGRAIDLEKQ